MLLDLLAEVLLLLGALRESRWGGDDAVDRSCEDMPVPLLPLAGSLCSVKRERQVEGRIVLRNIVFGDCNRFVLDVV